MERSEQRSDGGELRRDEEMPVVARMVVEVRSDGTRTLARGALEDLVTGQQVAIETPALTPLELATHLSKSLLLVSGAARDAVRGSVGALVPERVRRLKRRLLG